MKKEMERRDGGKDSERESQRAAWRGDVGETKRGWEEKQMQKEKRTLLTAQSLHVCETDCVCGEGSCSQIIPQRLLGL